MLIYSLRNLIIGYTITIIVVLLILLYTFSTLKSQEKELGKIQKSREALQVLGPALVNIQEFESDLSGYVNSRDKQDSVFYKDGINELENDSLQLSKIIATVSATEIASQYKLLLGFQREMKDYASLLLNLNKTKSNDIAKEQLSKGTGSRIVKAFKSVVNKLEDDNRQIISASYSGTISLTKKTFAFVKAIAAILFIILLISFFFHYRDIKKRERAEQQLKKFNEGLEKKVEEKTTEIRKSEERYRSLIEQASDYIMITDQTGNFSDVNSSLCKMFGYTREELLRSNISAIIDPEQLKTDPIQFDVLMSGRSVLRERRMMKKDGTIVLVEANVKRIPDGRILAIARDITERKKAEEEIVQANERFNLIARATNDAVWDWDMITDQNWGNEIFYKYYGIEPDSPSNNETFLSRLHPDDKERLLKNLQKAINNKEEQIIDEFRFRMPDGNYRYFYDRAYILYNADGKPYRMLGSMMDVTDLKKAEEEKEKARYQLNERVKELTTLYQSGQILQTETKSVEEVLKEIVAILPPGWQYPEITAARITLGKKEFATSNFAEGPHKQSAEFVAPDGEAGKIEVVYLEKRPQAQEGAFLTEERNLINMLAEMLRVYLDRKMATEELMKSEANLKTIFETTDDGYALLDINFDIVSYNQRGFDFVVNELGAKPGPSNNLIDYIPETRRPFLLNMKEEVVKGKNINYEVSYLQPGHSYKWYNIRMFSITNSEKKVLGLMIAASDITEKKLMEQEMVSQKVQEQKKIIRAVLKAEEKERNKIGQELHDNVSQILTGTKLYLSMAEKDEVGKKDLIKSSLELIDSAIKEIRSLSKSQVTPLKGVNLEALIYLLADKLNEISILKTTVDYEVNSQVIEDDLKLNIYRIVQEQTNNILKHAKASNIRISVKEDYEFLYVSVEDDGKGFDPSQKRNGIGISNMINRVESFNGELVIDSSPGNGCRLKIKIPY